MLTEITIRSTLVLFISFVIYRLYKYDTFTRTDTNSHHEYRVSVRLSRPQWRWQWTSTWLWVSVTNNCMRWSWTLRLTLYVKQKGYLFVSINITLLVHDIGDHDTQFYNIYKKFNCICSGFGNWNNYFQFSCHRKNNYTRWFRL